MVERHLAKVEVAGSSPVIRSKKRKTLLVGVFLFLELLRCRLRKAKPDFAYIPILLKLLGQKNGRKIVRFLLLFPLYFISSLFYFLLERFEELAVEKVEYRYFKPVADLLNR